MQRHAPWQRKAAHPRPPCAAGPVPEHAPVGQLPSPCSSSKRAPEPKVQKAASHSSPALGPHPWGGCPRRAAAQSASRAAPTQAAGSSRSCWAAPACRWGCPSRCKIRFEAECDTGFQLTYKCSTTAGARAHTPSQAAVLARVWPRRHWMQQRAGDVQAGRSRHKGGCASRPLTGARRARSWWWCSSWSWSTCRPAPPGSLPAGATSS